MNGTDIPLDDLAGESRASIGAKVGAIFVMFLLPFLIGLLPRKAAGLSGAAKFTSIANCFGGGIFFGTCFLHLMPEVAHELHAWKRTLDNDFVKSVPIAEILECLGFVLILLAESVAHRFNAGHSHESPATRNQNYSELNEQAVALKSNGNGTAEDDAEQPKNKNNNTWVLIFALVVHSIFEGLAIGVEAKTSVFLQLAGAILIHKCVVSFAVGTRLYHAELTLKETMIRLLIFCISSPIGISIAMIILYTLSSGSDVDMALISGLIQGLSTGFFLYITFVEMICIELQDGKDLLLKTLFLSIGITLIAISTVLHNYSEISSSG